MSKHMIFKGRNRVTQIYGGRHGGIDIVGDDDNAVHAVRNGRVCSIQKWDGHTKTGDQSYGNLIIIEDTSGRYHYYAHLDEIRVSVGDNIAYDDIIATMGDTGNSTGAHTHYEVRNGTSTESRIDPTPYCGVDNCRGTYISSGMLSETENKNLETPKKQDIKPSKTDCNGVYTVVPGDTLIGIAKRFGTDYKKLAKINGILNPNLIRVGQQIRITAADVPIDYYPAVEYDGVSIVDALKLINVDSSYSHRAQIAEANEIGQYSGFAAQNIKMLDLLKKGKLIKA